MLNFVVISNIHVKIFINLYFKIMSNLMMWIIFIIKLVKYIIYIEITVVKVY